jgi:F-box and WD-40 domain protein CDC4
MESTQHKATPPDMDTEYGALCQLSYAPATQTTVVTTTTTTTTSFPPFVVNSPRNLKDRDPKQYPLAATPTPSSMKRFCFNVDGKAACFQEADDTEVALQDVSIFSDNPPIHVS